MIVKHMWPLTLKFLNTLILLSCVSTNTPQMLEELLFGSENERKAKACE